MHRAAIVAAFVLGVHVPPAVAQADPEDFTPEGYEFCGWQDFKDRSWTLDDPQDGAYLRLFARSMSCVTARKHYARVRYTQLPPYRPTRIGYRCRTLDSDYEYSDVRCRKVGRPSVAFRWQTGA